MSKSNTNITAGFREPSSSLGNTRKPLPAMTVEQRNPKTGHRVPAPDVSPENIAEQTSDAIQLNQDAARLIDVRRAMYADVDRQLAKMSWPEETLVILVKHIQPIVPSVTPEDIVRVADEVLGCKGIDQLALWVQKDQCAEVFNRMLSYCLREGQSHKRNHGFIDGSGIGYLTVFTTMLKRNIEKTFDSKYFFKVPRLLQDMFGRMGVDLTTVANAINPGHWSYPQGHSTKSLTAVEALRQVFNLDKNCDRSLIIGALVFGHGRDANLIHYPMDTPAAGYNTGLKEFK